MSGGFKRRRSSNDDHAHIYGNPTSIDTNSEPRSGMSLKRGLAERSPNHPPPMAQDSNTEHAAKRMRRSDPDKSVYAIQKEALLRELKTSAQVRRQLEEQIVALKAEFRRKAEEFKRASPQLESQYRELSMRYNEIEGELDIAKEDISTKDQQLELLAAALDHDHQMVTKSTDEIRELKLNYDGAMASLLEMQAKCESLESMNEDKHRELDSTIEKLVALESDAAKRAELLTGLRNQLNSLTLERDDLLLIREGLETELSEINTELGSMRAMQEQLNEQLETQKDVFERQQKSSSEDYKLQLAHWQESLVQTNEAATEALAEERAMHEEARQKLSVSEQQIKHLNRKIDTFNRDKVMLQTSASEQSGLASRRINELDAELSELRPKYNNAKELASKSQKELRSLHQRLNEVSSDVQKLREENNDLRNKLTKITEENKLFDSQRIELALSLEREKKWRESIAISLAQSEDLCTALQQKVEHSATEFEQQSHEMHRSLEASRSEFERSQLELSIVRSQLDQLKQSKNDASHSMLEQVRRQEKAKIASLQLEISNQAEALNQERKTTRRLQNQIQELKGNIRIVARIRPLLSSLRNETDSSQQLGNRTFSGFNPAEPESIKANMKIVLDEIILNETETAAHGAPRIRSIKVQYDRVFGPNATNAVVCEETEYLVQSALDGRNVCILAYGQTGSGKTYTMGGEDGISMYALRNIVKSARSGNSSSAKNYEVSVESVEIYNEQIRDLLCAPSSNTQSLNATASMQPEPLSIQLNPKSGQPELVGAKRIVVQDENMAHEIMQRAMRCRSTAATQANQRSSRSHFIFTVHIKSAAMHGVLRLVDLAGSERLDHSQTTGNRLKETQAINTSLSSLGNVINALLNKRPSTHIPYRSSKLTFLLQGSLSSGAKTMLLTTLSPEQSAIEETKSTLRFADKASGAVLK